MKAQTTKPVAGVDVGYNYTKAKTAQGEALFRSIIGPAIAISYRSGIGRGVTGYEVARYGRQHFIGELARAQSPNPMTPQSRQRDLEIVVTLALTALAATGARGDLAKLVTGLPVSWYKQDHEALEHALTGHHEISVDGEAITFDIDAVRVVPQPFGTFFSQIVSDAGALTDGRLAKGKVAIFDVGGHTTDLALSDSLEFIEKAGALSALNLRSATAKLRRGASSVSCNSRDCSPKPRRNRSQKRRDFSTLSEMKNENTTQNH